MQFIDLKTQQQRIRDQINLNINKVLDHGLYILGPEVAELEKRLAAYIDVKHAIACASGTDALLLALMAYNIGPGDAVFTTPFTFVATAEVISLLGAVPVFVDIDPITMNIDPKSLEQAISQFSKNQLPIQHRYAKSLSSDLKAKAIIAVDIFGLPADYDAITAIANQNNLLLIEDAAQSFGATYKNKKACSFGNIGCTSFFPAKPLGGYGDGGMCFTNEDHLMTLIRSIAVHGQGQTKYDNVRIGINGRLDTLQAAILLPKCDIFDSELSMRQAVADRYSQLLKSVDSIVTPVVPENYTSVWAQYTILVKDTEHRTKLINSLQKQSIPTAIYYPTPLHLQPAFATYKYQQGDYPTSESIASRVLSLPMSPYTDAEDQKRICEIIAQES